jgi:phosphonate transport system ATP-binding protein
VNDHPLQADLSAQPAEARAGARHHRAPPALRVVGITKRFAEDTALDEVSLDLRPGEIVALVGPSGSGKSTLLRCLTRLVVPDSGRIDLLGADLFALSEAELRAKRRAVGMIFQQFNLVGRLSAIDNVLIGRLGPAPLWRVLGRRFADADRQDALRALDRVGLIDHAYQRADTLSGGQQQRVAIARVLAQNARVILADEPVSSLDPASARRVMEILRDVSRAEGIAVLCSLHQIDIVQGFADRVVGLRAGRVVFAERRAAIPPDTIAALYD